MSPTQKHKQYLPLLFFYKHDPNGNYNNDIVYLGERYITSRVHDYKKKW